MASFIMKSRKYERAKVRTHEGLWCGNLSKSNLLSRFRTFAMRNGHEKASHNVSHSQNVSIMEHLRRTSIMKRLVYVLVAVAMCAIPQRGLSDGARVYDIRTFDAVPGGKRLCTQAIQKAIDRCAERGGGTVYFPPGVWLSGTLTLRSHVTLELEAGACLLGSANPADFPEQLPKLRSYTDHYVRQSLIRGEDLEQVAIRGRGTIDGQGAKFRWKEYKNRPYVIRLVNCRDVLVEGITLRDAPMWMQHYLACYRVRIHGITVHDMVTYNNDGIDIDGCRDVVISDCMILSLDDALCLKSTSSRACENVTITNCVLSSHCNALKMGTESVGGFRNITITNCAISSPPQKGTVPFLRPTMPGVVPAAKIGTVPAKPLAGHARGISGIALELVDGGALEGITVSNVTIDGVNTPIFLRLGNRARPIADDMPRPGVGTFRNVLLSNIVATRTGRIGCSITGVPGHPIENVCLSNVQLSFEGGGSKQDAAKTVAEQEAHYPEASMFGVLPAYGFYCRHVVGLKLRDVQLRTLQPDLRHALVCDDVQRLVLDGIDVQPAADAAAAVCLIHSPAAEIHHCRELPVEKMRDER
jgi:polygalacturonase